MISLNEMVFFDSQSLKLHFDFGCGGNAALSNYWLRPWRKLVLALRQHPQGGAYNKPKPTISPSPLMGEESKARVKTMPQHRPNPANHPARHTGFKAVSTGQRSGQTLCDTVHLFTHNFC